MGNYLKPAAVMVSILVLLLVLLTVGNIAMFWGIFQWLVGYINVRAGMDPSAAKFVAALIMAIIVMVPTGKMVLAFTPIPHRDKGKNRSFIFLALAAFFLIIYFGGKDVFFDPQTGEPIQYYSVLPNGEYRFFSEPGFDPLTGVALKKVDSEVALKSKGLWSSPPPPQASVPASTYTEPVKPSEPDRSNSGSENVTKEDSRSTQKEVDHSSKRSAQKSNSLVSLDRSYHYEPPANTRPEIAEEPAETRRVTIRNRSHNELTLYDSKFNRVYALKSQYEYVFQLSPGTYYYVDANLKWGEFNVPYGKPYCTVWISDKHENRNEEANTLTRNRWR